jgi:hypothetical protein
MQKGDLDSERNWTEDFAHENGQYINRCMDCRKVFVGHDGADQGMEEWFAWYKPEQWFHSARALGAFIYTRLKPERDELSALRSEVAKLQKEMATREVEVADSLASAGAVVERLSADRLTQEQSAYLIELVELHAFSGRLRDESLIALRRLSEQGEGE